MSLEKILVLGDWLVDEHWAVGLHRSQSASRIGHRHSRALHVAQCSTRSLCGAGQTATILYNAKDGARELFDIIGLGLWHKGDEKELLRMLVPENNNGKTPYRLLWNDDAETPSITRARLYNLAGGDLAERVGTTRVIRVYEHKQSRVDLRERIDWELRLTQQLRGDISRQAAKVVEQIEDLKDVTAVVVKDLRKGAVTKELLATLTARLKEASWYVSSKQWHPDWLGMLPKEQTKLVLVPQLAADAAIRGGHVASSSWLTIGGSGSQEAMETINDLANKFPNAHVVVLPAGMQVLARTARTERNQFGYIQKEVSSQPYHGLVPMASVFFPALVSELRLGPKNVGLKAALASTLDYTDEWMRLEYGRIIEEDWSPTPAQNLALGKNHDRHFGVVSEITWESSIRHWEESKSHRGVVTYRRAKIDKLQIWRAMTEVGDYVACLPSKRKALKSLIEHGRLFDRERSRNMAFMLIDAPGSGKSYLVDCLARQLGMRFLKFNITQMLTREDLLRCFDKIETTGANNPQEPILVFIDEINAELGGANVYDAFLAPLEDGIYVRAGDTFHIRPCFWIFAGTREPKKEETKGSDFLSRLTRPPFIFGNDATGDNEEVNEAFRLEKIYVCGATIQRVFPDVRRVTRAVLRAIDMLPVKITPREISQFVKRFRSVQYGTISSENLPVKWHEEFNIGAREIDEWNEQKLKDDETDVILERSPELVRGV